jgi:hypothetical protein
VIHKIVSDTGPFAMLGRIADRAAKNIGMTLQIERQIKCEGNSWFDRASHAFDPIAQNDTQNAQKAR